MGLTFPALTPELTAWAQQQPVFFVASAPLRGRHVNVSPKGLAGSTLSILSPSLVAYVDRTGSGCETIAHLYENGRLTLMFMSVGPNPRIMRLFCRGRVVEWDEPGFAGWLDRMGCPRPEAVRSIIVADVWSVATSCGYAVPRVRKELYDEAAKKAAAEAQLDAGAEGVEGEEPLDPYMRRWEGENSVFEDRPTLVDRARWREKVGKVLEYQVQTNLESLDGLPGLRAARRSIGQRLWLTDLKARVRRILAEKEAIVFGFLLATLFYFVLSTKLFGVLEPSRIAVWKQQLQVLSPKSSSE